MEIWLTKYTQSFTKTMLFLYLIIHPSMGAKQYDKIERSHYRAFVTSLGFGKTTQIPIKRHGIHFFTTILMLSAHDAVL